MSNVEKRSFWARFCPSICGCSRQDEGVVKDILREKQLAESIQGRPTWEELKAEEAEQLEEYMNEQRKEDLKDFVETEDQKKAYTEEEIAEMDRYQRFEKQFPFYQIDVNGFFHLLQRAMKLTFKEDENKPLRDIKHVTLSALQEAFKNNKTWEDALVSDPPTKLVQFMNETCKAENEELAVDESDEVYEVCKISYLAILWCEDEAKEKLPEFWFILQDGDQPNIAAHDKDYKETLFNLFDLATVTVYRFEQAYTGATGESVNQEEIEAKKEEYDDIAETFLDEVFGFESVLQKDEYLQKVLETQTWVFSGQTIREKLGYEC